MDISKRGEGGRRRYMGLKYVEHGSAAAAELRNTAL